MSFEEELHSNGFVILRNQFQVPDPVRKELERQSNLKSSLPIFNENSTKRSDKNRLQVNLKRTRPIKDFIDQLDKLSQETNLITKDHHRSVPVLLRSKKGCQKQHAHSDYIPNLEFIKTIKEGQSGYHKIPLLFIYSIMYTKIDIWKKGIKWMGSRTIKKKDS